MGKILFVCYDGYNTTNTRVRCYRFSKELAKHNLKTEIFSFKDDLHARYDGFESGKSSIFERGWLLLRAISKLMKEESSTTFYVQKSGYFALAPLIVSKLKGNKLILDYDDYEYEQSPISKWVLKMLCKRAVFCVAASRYLESFLKNLSREVYYIPTGVDTDVFKPRKKRPAKEIVFAWVGFVVDRSAVDNLLSIIEAFDKVTRKNPLARLEIVGGGKHIEQITQKIDALANKRIIYKGTMSPDKIPSYLDTVDVGLFILSSNTKYNRSKSPTKLFEYMAKGLVVISTKIGESGKVIVDGQNGLIAETKNELISKALMLSREPALALGLGENAISSVKKEYSLAVLGRRLADIIKKEIADA